MLLVWCRSAAADFQSCAGTRCFDEEATIALWRAEAKSENEKKEAERLIEMKRDFRNKLGIPFHSDIKVTRTAIVGIRTMLTPRYDLISSTEYGATISAKVLWHEDQNDPGDASEETIVLSRQGKVLRLDTAVGLRISYLFVKESI
ncbi:MAG: hypothetical protein IPN11_05965 [Opitutaceae bacterium]|nr:hypothetical protein [Opitutaceae bacterium]